MSKKLATSWSKTVLIPDLHKAGFTIVEKTHGNVFQKGWPDYWIWHPTLKGIWVEVKMPRDRLTAAQHEKFSLWHSAGIPIWIIGPKNYPEDKDLFRFFKGTDNVSEFLKRGHRKVRIPKNWI